MTDPNTQTTPKPSALVRQALDLLARHMIEWNDGKNSTVVAEMGACVAQASDLARALREVGQ
jgi:hypothetical protein